MSYLTFVDLEIPAGQKTRRWGVVSGQVHLGEVRFYPQWRKFCFYPHTSTVFDAVCLNEIVFFCNHQNDVRREGQ